jgi:hypothetical protein
VVGQPAHLTGWRAPRCLSHLQSKSSSMQVAGRRLNCRSATPDSPEVCFGEATVPACNHLAVLSPNRKLRFRAPR